MTQWKYHEMTRKKDDISPRDEFSEFDKSMNEMGIEGWECYAVKTDYEYNKTYYLKRPFKTLQIKTQ